MTVDADLNYFAYGSNMELKTLQQQLPSAKIIGPARLNDFRLRFSRKSVRTGTGVADVVPAHGFAVWGLLYQVPASELGPLDRKEGLHLPTPAYRRINIEVRRKGSYVAAFTYVTLNPTTEEVSPASLYIAGIVSAFAANLDGSVLDQVAYLQFLKWLEEIAAQHTPGTTLQRPGLLVGPTQGRRLRVGFPILQYGNPGWGLTPRLRVVQQGNKALLVHWQADKAPLATKMMRLDQTARNVLGLQGQRCFGETMTLAEIAPRRLPAASRTRSVALSVHEGRREFAERGVCALSKANLTLLGCDEGDFVNIYVVVGNDIHIKRGHLRAFSIEALAPREGDSERRNWLFLDETGREQLGLTTQSHYLGAPVVVTPALGEPLREQSLTIGLAALFGVSAIVELINAIVPSLPDAPKVLLALVGAIGVAIGAAW